MSKNWNTKYYDPYKWRKNKRKRLNEYLKFLKNTWIEEIEKHNKNWENTLKQNQEYTKQQLFNAFKHTHFIENTYLNLTLSNKDLIDKDLWFYGTKDFNEYKDKSLLYEKTYLEDDLEKYGRNTFMDRFRIKLLVDMYYEGKIKEI